MAITTAPSAKTRNGKGKSKKHGKITGNGASRRSADRRLATTEEMAALHVRAAGALGLIERTQRKVAAYEGYDALVAEARPDHWAYFNETASWLNAFTGTPIEEQAPLTAKQLRQGGAAINIAARLSKEITTAMKPR